MSERLAAILALIAFVAVVVGALVTGGQLSGEEPGMVAFQIATGSTEGVYFPVGQAMSQLISHPQGVGRCDTATVCGPAGVVLSARTSQGAADNLRSVNAGTVDSGFADGDMIANAVTGRPPIRAKAAHLRVMAALFTEDLHLVATTKANIHTVGDLRGKRLYLGTSDSGGAVRGRAVLSAFGVGRVQSVPSNGDTPEQMLKDGRIDAYFVMAGAPMEAIKTMIARHVAQLVPIDGEGRDRLIRNVPQLARAVIPGGIYPGTGPIQTVSTHAYWITRDSQPDPLVYGLVRALFNPANRPGLSASHPSAHEIMLSLAAAKPPAPLHKGAARYYREVGVLPR